MDVLCVIHNFIQRLDPDVFFTPEFQAEHLEQLNVDDGNGDKSSLGFLADGPVDVAERQRQRNNMIILQKQCGKTIAMSQEKGDTYYKHHDRNAQHTLYNISGTRSSIDSNQLTYHFNDDTQLSHH